MNDRERLFRAIRNILDTLEPRGELWRMRALQRCGGCAWFFIDDRYLDVETDPKELPPVPCPKCGSLKRDDPQ